MMTNHGDWMMQEAAQQELLDLWEEWLPMPFFSQVLFLGEMDRRIKEMYLWDDRTPLNINPEAALEVLDAYLF